MKIRVVMFVVAVAYVLTTTLWALSIERTIKVLSTHADILAQAIQQEQYQIDVITQYIKGDK